MAISRHEYELVHNKNKTLVRGGALILTTGWWCFMPQPVIKQAFNLTASASKRLTKEESEFRQ